VLFKMSDQQGETMDTTEVNVVNEDERKLFVGGLPQDAKDTDIKEHFGQFGEIDGVNLKTDPATGRSRGFAFVVFKDQEGLEKAVATEEHNIKNKKVAVKKAQAKQGKVYVGKLPKDDKLSDDAIKEFFATYGTIAAVEQPFDKVKSERKNFCFITFEKEESAKALLKVGTVTLNDSEGNPLELEVKKVTVKAPVGPGAMGFAGRGGRGGGAGWGGMGGGYGDWSGYGYGGPYGGYDPYGYGNWGYGPYGGGYGYGGMAGGKTPRGGQYNGPARGRGAQRGQRQKPY